MNPIIVLRASNGLLLRSPEESIIGAAVNALAGDDHVILEYEGESGENVHYIQVWLRPDGDFQLEYRAGEPNEHYQTITPHRGKVASALTGWMRGGSEWRNDFDWRSIGDWFR